MHIIETKKFRMSNEIQRDEKKKRNEYNSFIICRSVEFTSMSLEYLTLRYHV